VRDTAAAVFRPVGNAWNGIFHYGDLKDENERLRRQVAALQGTAVQQQDAKQQLAEIAGTNGLPVTSQIPSVLARVDSGPVSNFDHTIVISKGTGAGVKKGMPVITGAGLVGRVVQASSSRATVQLISDPGFDMGVRLVTSGAVGIAHGRGDISPLSVDILDPKVKITKGEPVTTSEFARSIFPPDIPVGAVLSAELSSDQRQQALEVQPLADLQGSQYVRVLLWEPQQ
jgi:rod shape-determining protein MreC